MIPFWIAAISCAVAAIVNLTYVYKHPDSAVKLYTGLLALGYLPGYVAVLAGGVGPAAWSAFYIWFSVPAWLVWILPALTDWRRRGD